MLLFFSSQILLPGSRFFVPELTEREDSLDEAEFLLTAARSGLFFVSHKYSKALSEAARHTDGGQTLSRVKSEKNSKW